MLASHAETADQGNTVRVVVDLYGRDFERNGRKCTLSILVQTCTSAVERFGDKSLLQWKPSHVSDRLAHVAKPLDTQ